MIQPGRVRTYQQSQEAPLNDPVKRWPQYSVTITNVGSGRQRWACKIWRSKYLFSLPSQETEFYHQDSKLQKQRIHYLPKKKRKKQRIHYLPKKSNEYTTSSTKSSETSRGGAQHRPKVKSGIFPSWIQTIITVLFRYFWMLQINNIYIYTPSISKYLSS